MSEILINVEKRIREIRKARGLPQTALVEKYGFTFSG
jgi:transcriptional regulator with XRE-family HTH domain